MKKEKKEKHFIKKPFYPGGTKALKAFVSNELVYPAEAIKKGIEGVVRVSYTINQRGKVIQTKVINHLGYGCDEEAVRIVRLLKFQVPKNRSQKILFHKSVNIHFQLSKNPVVQYEYTTSSEPPSNQGGSYFYDITLP